MAKRKPNIAPHLAGNTSSITNKFSNRRKGLIPSQTTLSVQNIPDYSTKAGASMANEEMRRLRLGINSIKDTIDTAATTTQPIAAAANIPVSPTPKEDDGLNANNIINTEWALTVYKKGLTLNPPKLIQGLNFNIIPIEYFDGKTEIGIPVEFEIKPGPIDPKHKTVADARRVTITAKALTNFVDWVNLEIIQKDSVQITNQTRRDEYGDEQYVYVEDGLFKGFSRKVISLINDEEDPGLDKVYGTGPDGHKGWKDMPSAQGFRHTQSIPSYAWNIHHNLNKFPAGISTFDLNGDQIVGIPKNITNKHLLIMFLQPVSGYADLI